MKKTLPLFGLILAFLLGLSLSAKAYRDLETGTFITKDPAGDTLMMPKEKWMVDGREVKQEEHEAALEPGVPQAGNGPSKTAKDSGQEADTHTATASGEKENPGQKSRWHTAAAGFPNLYTYVNENPWTFFDPEGLDAEPAGGGNYRFVVNPANFGASSLGELVKQVSGKFVSHPNPYYTGQCATGAQYLTGEKVNGQMHDAPETQISKKPNWTRGAPLSNETKPGTMVAWGWDANGNYPNQRTGNHTAIYVGKDNKGRPLVLEQNYPSKDSPNGEYHVRPVKNGEKFYEVNSRQKHDPKKTESKISEDK